MKINIIISIFLCFSLNLLHSQYIPKYLDFIGMKANWKYLPEDTNFIKSPIDKTSTPYSNRFPVFMTKDKDNILILERVDGQSPWGGSDGFLLHSLKGKTGSLNWINHNNKNSGNTHLEDFGGSDMFIDGNGNYELVGLRSIHPLDTSQNYSYFYCTPIKRVINSEKGKTISVVSNQDTSEHVQNLVGIGNRNITNSEGITMRVAQDIVFKDTILQDKIQFFSLDENMKLILPCKDSIIHDTGIRTLSPYLRYLPSIRLFNRDTMVVLFGIKNPEDSKYSPAKLELYYINIKSDIEVKKIIDITDDIYYPQDVWNSQIQIKTKDENVIIMQQIEFLSDTSFVWLSWYDKHGNKVGKIDKIKYNDYLYTGISILGVKDGVLYIAGNFEDDDVEGFDILKILPGHNNIEKCGQLYLPGTWLAEYYISNAYMFDEDLIAIGFRVFENYDNPDFDYDYQFYSCFNSSDLGIVTNTVDIDRTVTDLDIYPNPASNSISISCKNDEGMTIEVIDKLGRVILIDKSDGCTELSIDISELNSDLYFVRLIDDSGRIVGTGKFIKE